MSAKKATVNFQHAGAWYGPDHGDGTVPAEVAKEVGPHLFEQVEDESEQDADPAPAKARTSRPAKD